MNRPKTFRRKLKIKNCCAQCGRRWTSMKGVAEFKVVPGAPKHMACLLYQQRCNRCDVFVEPRYYTEEFSDLVMAVARKFDNPHNKCLVRAKQGNPRGYHRDCEACELGVNH